MPRRDTPRCACDQAFSTAALVAALCQPVMASTHREAPLIVDDSTSGVTDFYLFASPPAPGNGGPGSPAQQVFAGFIRPFDTDFFTGSDALFFVPVDLNAPGQSTPSPTQILGPQAGRRYDLHNFLPDGQGGFTGSISNLPRFFQGPGDAEFSHLLNITPAPGNGSGTPQIQSQTLTTPGGYNFGFTGFGTPDGPVFFGQQASSVFGASDLHAFSPGDQTSLQNPLGVFPPGRVLGTGSSDTIFSAAANDRVLISDKDGQIRAYPVTVNPPFGADQPPFSLGDPVDTGTSNNLGNTPIVAQSGQRHFAGWIGRSDLGGTKAQVAVLDANGNLLSGPNDFNDTDPFSSVFDFDLAGISGSGYAVVAYQQNNNIFARVLDPAGKPVSNPVQVSLDQSGGTNIFNRFNSNSAPQIVPLQDRETVLFGFINQESFRDPGRLVVQESTSPNPRQPVALAPATARCLAGCRTASSTQPTPPRAH